VGDFLAAAALPRTSVRLGRARAHARWVADARSGWGALGRAVALGHGWAARAAIELGMGHCWRGRTLGRSSCCGGGAARARWAGHVAQERGEWRRGAGVAWWAEEGEHGAGPSS
jgi:hypothetical protein